MIASKHSVVGAATTDAMEQRMNEVLVTMDKILHDNLHLKVVVQNLKANVQRLASKVAQLEQKSELFICFFFESDILLV